MKQFTAPHIVTSIGDLDTVLRIARQQGVTHLKIGSIEAVFGAVVPAEPRMETLVSEEPPTTEQIDREARLTYQSL